MSLFVFQRKLVWSVRLNVSKVRWRKKRPMHSWKSKRKRLKKRRRKTRIWMIWWVPRHIRSFWFVTLGGDKSEYVNPCIPTQAPEEDYSCHMHSPGWPPTLCVARCLIWWFVSLVKVWSYMTPNVLIETRFIKQHKRFWLLSQSSLQNGGSTAPLSRM